jgi:hypothetical protein
MARLYRERTAASTGRGTWPTSSRASRHGPCAAIRTRSPLLAAMKAASYDAGRRLVSPPALSLVIRGFQPVFKAKAAILSMLALAACSKEGEIMSGGILTTRTACPAVAIPAGTGDITLFNPAGSKDASAIDVVATVTNIRSTCNDSGEYVATTATFDVQAQRRDPRGEREVVLPYFATVVQGGTNVVSKRLGRVALRFADGQYRASTSGQASSQVLRSAATLPENIRREITRDRKPGDPDAAIDPLARPDVRAAVQRATFEVLVGFQLTPEQLAYNVTR